MAAFERDSEGQARKARHPAFAVALITIFLLILWLFFFVAFAA
jgi:hypothetical protein